MFPIPLILLVSAQQTSPEFECRISIGSLVSGVGHLNKSSLICLKDPVLLAQFFSILETIIFIAFTIIRSYYIFKKFLKHFKVLFFKLYFPSKSFICYS